MWMAYSVPHKFGVFLSRTRRKHAGSSSSSSFYHGHAAAIAARPSRKSVCVRQERLPRLPRPDWHRWLHATGGPKNIQHALLVLGQL